VLIALQFRFLKKIKANTMTGTFIDRTGYELPLLMGLTVMFSSTLMFSIMSRYWITVVEVLEIREGRLIELNQLVLDKSTNKRTINDANWVWKAPHRIDWSKLIKLPQGPFAPRALSDALGKNLIHVFSSRFNTKNFKVANQIRISIYPRTETQKKTPPECPWASLKLSYKPSPINQNTSLPK